MILDSRLARVATAGLVTWVVACNGASQPLGPDIPDPALSVSIDGPSWLSQTGSLTWEAVPSPTNDHAYEWYELDLCEVYWPSGDDEARFMPVGAGLTYTRDVAPTDGPFRLRVVVTSGSSEKASAELEVWTSWAAWAGSTTTCTR